MRWRGVFSKHASEGEIELPCLWVTVLSMPLYEASGVEGTMKDKAADGGEGHLCPLQARSYTGMFDPIVLASRKHDQDLIKQTLATATIK